MVTTLIVIGFLVLLTASVFIGFYFNDPFVTFAAGVVCGVVYEGTRERLHDN
jgi:uncharacterized membrane protein (UPF0136 family)